MSVRARNSRKQDVEVLSERRQAAGFRFFVVEQGGVILPVLAQSANQATGIFLAWQKFSFRQSAIDHKPFACVGIYNDLPIEFSHYAIFCGRRNGRPLIKIVRPPSQS